MCYKFGTINPRTTNHPMRVTKIAKSSLHSDVTVCNVLPDGTDDAHTVLRVEHTLGATQIERNADIEIELSNLRKTPEE